MNEKQSAPMNLPNTLTVLRLVLAVFLFISMDRGYGWAALVLFLLAAGTDWLDGYFARKWKMITTLGRVLDPFADKVIICGTFIFLAANPVMQKIPWGLRAWMVVVIVVREILVTMLRSMIEERGGDFSAKWSGKIKMILQCVVATTCLYYLACDYPAKNGPAWCTTLLIASAWATVVSTVYSGGVYVVAALRVLKIS
jgi:CDP-diacylglycerol---glycerol-3-phosphate 3-phosphatidyltransferase